MFKKAERKRAKLRLAIEGPSGSGKTYSAILVARGLVGPNGKIAIVDTENESASLYAHLTEYDTCPMSAPYNPERFVEVINEAAKDGYDALVIDSITHEWSGPGGCTEINDNYGGRFSDWAKTTPRHNKFINAMLTAPMHIIVTMRSKESYLQTQDDRGKQKIEKQGEAPQQRQGIAYEFTTVLTMNVKHLADSSKDRTGLFPKDELFMPSQDTGRALAAWLNSGAEVPPVDEAAVKESFDSAHSQDALDAALKALGIGRDHPQAGTIGTLYRTRKAQLKVVGDVPQNAEPAQDDGKVSPGQLKAIQTHYTLWERDARLRDVSDYLRRTVPSFSDLTVQEAHAVLEGLKSGELGNQAA